MAVVSMYVFFTKATSLLQNYFFFRGRKDLFFSMIISIVMGPTIHIPYLFILDVEMLLLYLVAFAADVTILVTVGAVATKTYRLSDAALVKHLRVPKGSIAVFSVLVILTTATWLGLFGPTYSSGHGILLQEYPVYCNVSIDVVSDQTALLNFSYRPPSLDQAWQLVKDRDDWPLYLEVTAMSVERMFNTSKHEVLSMETTDDDFWKDGRWHSGGARLITVQLDLSESPNWQRIEDEFILTIHDPWKPRWLAFLNAVNITSTAFSIVDYEYAPSAVMNIPLGGVQESYLLWLNTHLEESPETYVITFK
jgi:hypothetical protein